MMTCKKQGQSMNTGPNVDVSTAFALLLAMIPAMVGKLPSLSDLLGHAGLIYTNTNGQALLVVRQIRWGSKSVPIWSLI